MSHLKKEMANKCFTLLREYIDEGSLSSKKEQQEQSARILPTTAAPR